MQSQYSTLLQFNQAPEFFAENDGDYWEPASDTKDLYEQLSNKKYREILRNQIQYVKYTAFILLMIATKACASELIMIKFMLIGVTCLLSRCTQMQRLS